MKISFDIGGVLSKYPDMFRTVARALNDAPDIDVYVLTDMHEHEKSVAMVHGNGFDFIAPERIINSDYAGEGGYCKAVAIEAHGIDLHVDDFPDYCAHTKCVSLFVWPNPHEPYYADDWKTDGSEGAFGRRARGQMKQTP